MPSTAAPERAALADLLRERGPRAPTLCEGWDGADLAAHLVVRSRRPDAALGFVLPPLSGYAERVRIGVRDTTAWETLVDEVRAGPPVWSPLHLPVLDAAANTMEYFVHHEDLRRAAPDWSVRALGSELTGALWTGLKRVGRVTLRSMPVGLTLVAPGHGEWRVGGQHVVTVTGDPGELVLFAFGRGDHARLTYDGPADDVARVRAAHPGL